MYTLKQRELVSVLEARMEVFSKEWGEGEGKVVIPVIKVNTETSDKVSGGNPGKVNITQSANN